MKRLEIKVRGKCYELPVVRLVIPEMTHRLEVRNISNSVSDSKSIYLHCKHSTEEIIELVKRFGKVVLENKSQDEIVFLGKPQNKGTHQIIVFPKDKSQTRSVNLKIPNYSSTEIRDELKRYLEGKYHEN